MTRKKPTSLKAALDRIKILEVYLETDRQTVKYIQRDRDALWGRLKASEIYLSQANSKIQSLQADMVKSKRHGLTTAKATGELVERLGYEMQRYANTGLTVLDLVSESQIPQAFTVTVEPKKSQAQWIAVDADGKISCSREPTPHD